MRIRTLVISTLALSLIAPGFQREAAAQEPETPYARSG